MIIGKNISCYKRVTDGGHVSVILEHRLKNETLLFEKGVVAELGPSETDEIKKLYSKSLDCYAFLGALKLHIGEEYFIFLLLVNGCVSVGKIKEDEILKITSCSYMALQENSEVDSCITELQKLLSSGSYFFSVSSNGYNTFDLSLCAQRRHLQQQSDNRFFWNRALHLHLERFGINCNEWLVKIMCGFVQIKTVYVGASQAKACLISRLSCERAGTRFNVRGTNDEGHVANFVETEQLIVLENSETSFIQTRGSVPVFWEQPGVQVGSHRIKFSRGYEASSPAFDRHIASLKAMYGYQLLVNLLGRKEGEHTLSMAYKDHLKDSKHSYDTHIVLFDYHYHCRGGKTENLQKLIEKAHASIENFGFFVYEKENITKSQLGTIRTNCVDCLDRTNAVQTKFGQTVLPEQLASLGISDKSNILSRFEEVFKTTWVQNGDQLSKLYSGTGAMDSGVKGTLGSKFHDGAVSVKRAIVNNFLDGSKQEAIDILLLGNTFIGTIGERARALLNASFLHSSPSILKELCHRHEEYTKISELRVCCGTWNVNGGKHFRSIAYKHMSMHDWLLDYHVKAPEGIIDKEENLARPPDIYALGFEEIVDLNANNIISTSSTQKKEWGSELQRVISRDHPYALITAEQLVGVCLYVFVRVHHLPYVRDVAVDTVKTGMKGSAGNKGAVAIRLLMHSTSICFVCAHLAAGQSNVQERNNNYHDISRRISFPMGSSLASHDYVFWCGDFNYRIDLPNEDVKELVKNSVWPELRANDQLSVQKAEGKIFRRFQEGPIRFAPTYKYDLFSDDYDTSEKQRSPAWTDRVLWSRKQYKKRDADSKQNTSGNSDDESSREESIVRGENIWNPGRILYYGRAELKTSDHRPVIAVVEIETQKVDQSKLIKVHKETIQSFGPANPTIIIKADRSVEELPDDFELDIEAALMVFQQYGNIVLARAVDDEVMFTYDEGRSALASLEMNARQLDGVQIEVTLKNTETLSKTEPSVHSLVSLDVQHDTDGEEESNLSLSDLLSCSRECRSGSLLLPEKLDQQADFLDDDTASIDGLLEGASSDEEDIDDELETETQEEMVQRRREEMIDSDEEEENTEEETPSNDSLPKRPNPPQQRPAAPPQRPTAPPKRPAAPKKTTAPAAKRQDPPVIGDRIEISNDVEIDIVACKREEFVKTRSQPSFSEFDPLTASPKDAAPKKPERPGRPERPKRPDQPKQPTQISDPAKPVKLQEESKQGSSASKEEVHSGESEKDLPKEDDISNPFNVSHLLHVNASNVDEFLAKLAKSSSLPPKLDVLKIKRRAPDKPKSPGPKEKQDTRQATDSDDRKKLSTNNVKPTPRSDVSLQGNKTELKNVDRRDDELVENAESCATEEGKRRAPPRPKKRPISAAVKDISSQEFPNENQSEQKSSEQTSFDGVPTPPPRNASDQKIMPMNDDSPTTEKESRIEIDDLYATVNKPRPTVKRRDTNNAASLHQESDSVPPLPPRTAASEEKDTSVVDLQECEYWKETDEQTPRATPAKERQLSLDTKPVLPPRKQAASPSDDVSTDDLYATVNKSSKKRIDQSTVIVLNASGDSVAPPLPETIELPERSDFAEFDDPYSSIDDPKLYIQLEDDLAKDIVKKRVKPPLPARSMPSIKRTQVENSRVAPGNAQVNTESEKLLEENHKKTKTKPPRPARMGLPSPSDDELTVLTDHAYEVMDETRPTPPSRKDISSSEPNMYSLVDDQKKINQSALSSDEHQQKKPPLPARSPSRKNHSVVVSNEDVSTDCDPMMDLNVDKRTGISTTPRMSYDQHVTKPALPARTKPVAQRVCNDRDGLYATVEEGRSDTEPIRPPPDFGTFNEKRKSRPPLPERKDPRKQTSSRSIEEDSNGLYCVVKDLSSCASENQIPDNTQFGAGIDTERLPRGSPLKNRAKPQLTPKNSSGLSMEGVEVQDLHCNEDASNDDISAQNETTRPDSSESNFVKPQIASRNELAEMRIPPSLPPRNKPKS